MMMNNLPFNTLEFGDLALYALYNNAHKFSPS